MAAHIKCGLNPIFIDLIQRGILSAVAFNGAGAIHDFELATLARQAKTFSGLDDGSFGMIDETGRLMNQALAAGEAGSRRGPCAREAVVTGQFRNRELSILHQSVVSNIPATVHIAIGTDIIHQHPTADGAVLGKQRTLIPEVRRRRRQIEGGIVLNIGSAVIMPRFPQGAHDRPQLGHTVENFTTVTFDMIATIARRNVVRRPTQRAVTATTSSATTNYSSVMAAASSRKYQTMSAFSVKRLREIFLNSPATHPRRRCDARPVSLGKCRASRPRLPCPWWRLPGIVLSRRRGKRRPQSTCARIVGQPARRARDDDARNCAACSNNRRRYCRLIVIRIAPRRSRRASSPPQQMFASTAKSARTIARLSTSSGIFRVTLETVSAVIFEDYAKGVLSQRLLNICSDGRPSAEDYGGRPNSRQRSVLRAHCGDANAARRSRRPACLRRAGAEVLRDEALLRVGRNYCASGSTQPAGHTRRTWRVPVSPRQEAAPYPTVAQECSMCRAPAIR